jgi:transposase
MHRIQELVRLHRLGQGQRSIAQQLRMGRETIRSYQRKLAEAGLLEGTVADLPDSAVLKEVVGEGPSEQTQTTSSVERWKPKISQLYEKGCGPTAIHDYLRLHEPDYSGSLSAIKRICRRLKAEAGPRAEDVAIRVETAPGEVAQVDFGYAGLRYDPARRVLRKCWVFVMTLGFSRDCFCDLVFDQKISTWLDLHVRAFEYFGGVPQVLVPDNLKSAVIRASFGVDGDPVLNRSYRELARHYGLRVDPTPPRAPEKKGKVESSVKYVRRNFLGTWETVDINEDRRQLQRWVEEIAGQRKHGSTGRRPRELFEEVEAQALSPLPASRWDPVVWKKVTVHRDSHVQVDGAFYSAPWRYLAKQLWARCTSHSVAIYHDDDHLHTHGRVPRGARQTVDGHLPEHRRDLRHRSSSYWIQKAETLGPEVAELATEIFAADDVLLQLRRVQAVIRHLETFPRERARKAAARALRYGCLSYGAIKNILRKGLDLEPLPEQSPRRQWASGSRFARQANFFSSSYTKE